MPPKRERRIPIGRRDKVCAESGFGPEAGGSNLFLGHEFFDKFVRISLNIFVEAGFLKIAEFPVCETTVSHYLWNAQFCF